MRIHLQSDSVVMVMSCCLGDLGSGPAETA